jgi:hypothetical protein
MASVDVSEFPKANWPLVVGVGILAAVVFYALYIVNEQLNTAVDPLIAQIQNLLNNAQQAIANPLCSWFGIFCSSGSSDSDSADEGGGSAF